MYMCMEAYSGSSCCPSCSALTAAAHHVSLRVYEWLPLPPYVTLSPRIPMIPTFAHHLSKSPLTCSRVFSLILSSFTPESTNKRYIVWSGIPHWHVTAPLTTPPSPWLVPAFFFSSPPPWRSFYRFLFFSSFLVSPCSLRLRFATHGLLFHVFPSLSSRTRFLRVFLSHVPSTSLVFINYVFKYCAQYPNHGSKFRLFLFPCPLFLFSLSPGRSLVRVLSYLIHESPAHYDRHASNINHKVL